MEEIFRVQSFPFSLWWLCEIALKHTWVEVPALTKLRYINYTVIIPLRLLGSYCSCQGAAPYKCTELPRVRVCHKTSHCQFVKTGRNRWNCILGLVVNYSILRKACSGSSSGLLSVPHIIHDVHPGKQNVPHGLQHKIELLMTKKGCNKQTQHNLKDNNEHSYVRRIMFFFSFFFFTVDKTS